MLRSALRIIAILLLMPVTLAAQDRRTMSIVDIINVPSVGDPELSPDGRAVAYVISRADWERNRTVSHIWVVNADGSDNRQLTNGPQSESSPRWSPDGSTIAFTTRRNDDDDYEQIYLISLAGGEARRLSEHATSVSALQWSPDGRSILFLASDPKTDDERAKDRAKDDVYRYDESYKHRHLWRIDVNGGQETRITEGDYSVLRYSLSRDGTRIAFHRGPSPLFDDSDEAEVWVMAADGSGARRLTENRVPESGAQLSPDNSRVLFVCACNGAFETYYNDKLFVVPAGGGPARVLLADHLFEVNGAAWSAGGRAIFLTANTGVRNELFRYDVERDRLEQVTRGDHTVRGWSYRPTARAHAFGLETATNGGDVYVLRDGARQPARVTREFDYLAATFRLPRVEAISWNGADGVAVEGLLWYPLDYEEGRRYPLVVQTHGGPASSDKFEFPGSGDYVQTLAGLGYMVLQPNYRGSTGYGDAFLRDMVGHYFNQAHLDVMAGVDHLIARGMVDGDRMAKMGWSAGGHMTNKIITFTDRFKAASSGAGAVNWISMYGQSDVRIYRTPWFGGTPWQEDAPIDTYWAQSPLKDVAKVTTPTLVLVGENDPRVPMPQSVELFRALRANGVPTHLYVAPREPHGWRELRHRLFKANVELDWFERWVMEREYQWETAPGEQQKPAREY